MQKLIVFLGRDALSVAEVRHGQEAKYKSVGGKISTKYNDFKRIEKFVEELCSVFNVDNFADDSFDILIISCGAEQETLSKLFALCHGAEHLNVVDVEKILPWLVWNKKQLKAGEKIVVQFASLSYEVACDKKKLITCAICDGKAELEVSVADFAMLFCMDVSKMVGGDSEELKQIKKLLATTETSLGEQLKEQTDLASKLSVEVDKKKNKIAELKKMISELKEKLPPEPSEIQKRVIEKIKKFRDNGSLSGMMYVKGEIPKQKLNEALHQIKKCNAKVDSFSRKKKPGHGMFENLVGSLVFEQSSHSYCKNCSFKNVHVSESEVLALYDYKSRFGPVTFLFMQDRLMGVHKCKGSLKLNDSWKYDEINIEASVLEKVKTQTLFCKDDVLMDLGLMPLIKELQTKV